MAAEARLLAKTKCLVLAGGGTPEGAQLQAQAAIAQGATALLSFGLAGGLDPTLPAGTLIVPDSVLWHDRAYPTDPALTTALGGPTCHLLFAGDTIIASATDKRALHHRTQAAAIDLESGPIAALAHHHALPFGVLRAICDPASRDLPPAALAALKATGIIGLRRVATSIAHHPTQLPALLRLADDARRAQRTLGRHLGRMSVRQLLQR